MRQQEFNWGAGAPSDRSPLATIRNASSGIGRCSSSASGVSALSHRSTSAEVVRMTGMAFGWIGATIALASVVRKPKCSCSPSTGALLGPLTPRQGVQRPAKAKSGLSSPRANQTGVLRGLVSAYSQKDVAGTTHRLPLPSHRPQCGLLTFRTFVTGCPPNCGGPGMPQRAMRSSRSPLEATRMIGAIWSGKIAGRGGRLPARSRLTANRSRIACWPLVTL